MSELDPEARLPGAKKPRMVLLAAGQGSRLGELTKSRHKSLLPVAGEPLLRRTVRQFREAGFENISVVVGHLAESIESELAGTGAAVELLKNPNYANDTNIGSLIIGIAGRMEPTLVVEADIAFDDGAVAEIARAVETKHSIWFTRGYLRDYKLGGCMLTGPNEELLDLRYVPECTEEFENYRKWLGVLLVSASGIESYHRLLLAAASETTSQYYMMPWCTNLQALPAFAHDLSHHKTATFNTPAEYEECCKIFPNPTLMAAARCTPPA